MIKQKICFINDAINCMEKIGLNNDSECSIIIETGYDEAIIVGTDSAYLELALSILKFVKNAISHSYEGTDLEEQIVDGDIAITSNFVEENFNELSDVMPICAYLAEEKKIIDNLIKKLKNYN